MPMGYPDGHHFCFERVSHRSLPYFCDTYNCSYKHALLACFICISIAYAPLQRWDRDFFFLAPILGGILVAVLFLHVPANMRSSLVLERYIATVEVWFCTAIWWLRLSCWRTQPGPTFLLGIAPIIQITLMQPINSYNETTVFFSQVMLLSILLGTLRILQCELRH